MMKIILAFALLVPARAGWNYSPKYKECGQCCFSHSWMDSNSCGYQDHFTCWTPDQICEFESGPDRMNEPLHVCGDHCCRADKTELFELWRKCEWYPDDPTFMKVPGTNYWLGGTKWCGKPCCEDYGECCYADYNNWGNQCADAASQGANYAGECISPEKVCQKWGYSLCDWSSEYCCKGNNFYKVKDKCGYLKYLPGIKDGDWCEKTCGDEPPATYGKSVASLGNITGHPNLANLT